MQAYIPILMFVIVALLFSVGTIIMSHLIVPRRRSPRKMSPYECGVEPVGNARGVQRRGHDSTAHGRASRGLDAGVSRRRVSKSQFLGGLLPGLLVLLPI